MLKMFNNCEMLHCKRVYIAAITICNLGITSCNYDSKKIKISGNTFVLFCSNGTPLTASNGQVITAREAQ